MAGLLADVFSFGDTLKRKARGLLDDPIGTISQFVNNENDRARAFNQLTSQSTNEMISGQTMGPASQKLAGLLADAYNPAGMVVWHGSPYKFTKLKTDNARRDVDAVWLSDSRPYAEWVASHSPDKVGNVYKVDADFKNPMVLDILEEAKRIADDVGLPKPSNALEAQELLSGGMGWDTVAKNYLDEAVAGGHDALEIRNFNDAFHSNPNEVTTAFLTRQAELLKLLERNGKPIGLLGE